MSVVMKKEMPQGEFAKFYGVSQPMVSKYISQGKIPAVCIVSDGKYKKIRVGCAVKALKQNLDPTRTKPGKPQADGEQAQEATEYIKQLKLINLGDPGPLITAIDTISLYQEQFVDPDSYLAMENVINQLAGLFGLVRMDVQGAPCRLCVSIPDCGEGE